MKGRITLHDPAAMAANDRVRANLEQLMEMRRLNQKTLANQIGHSQPWLSKRMTGKTPFCLDDLDALAAVLGLTPAQLLQDGYGKLDRRCGEDRRSGHDRRRIGERFQAPTKPRPLANDHEHHSRKPS